MIGSRLAHYEVTAHLGSGGMGDVYCATDAKLGRSVAIKLLPEVFARDEERSARLEREARTLAMVSHPNIAAIYGMEEAGAVKFLVMELAAGDTLAERIARGPIPLSETLAIVRQIADALDTAHEKGIVHRDLKPANIKVTTDGQVKVLDFGLAKALTSEGGRPEVSNSLTMSFAATSPGVIQGTVPYMSPEQAQGRETDRRTDIFALGCVMYEMLTGQQAFQGDSAPQILTKVIERDPDWSLLPSSTPASVRRLLRRCMHKDRTRRLKSADTIRIEVDEALVDPVSADASDKPASNPRLPWIVAGVLLASLIAVSIPAVLYVSASGPEAGLELRTDIVTPTTSDPASFAISPDGKYIAFVASGTGQQRLWLRRLDNPEARPLAGTEGANFPFWSPNSQSIGFFDGSKLKRVDISGGIPRVLADAANRGGTWNNKDQILYAKSVGSGLFRISASGGTPEQQTELENQTSHRFPYFLPDGRHFIYYAIGAPNVGGLYLGTLDSPKGKRLVTSESAGIYADGWMMFVRGGRLLAQKLDVEQAKVEGEPTTVAETTSFEASSYGAAISASLTGLIAYRAGGANRRQLTWFNRSGEPQGTWGPPDDSLLAPNISADGKRVAAWRTLQGNADIWLLDASRMTRLTFDQSLDRYAVWAKDNNRIFFDSARKGPRTIFEIRPDAPGSETVLFESTLDKVVNDVSPDGRTLLLNIADPQTGWDLWTVPVQGERKPSVLLKTNFEERRGQFSPDGRWITYTSNESGQSEVYVRSVGGVPGQWQISSGGGAFGRWASNSKELYYLAPDGTLMATPITVKESAIEPGASIPLFRTRIVGGGTDMNLGIQFDVSPDGRFLINTLLEDVGASPITLVQNWKPK
jgi:serine/threonine protein kinase